MLVESHLLNYLEQYAISPGGQQSVYGDPAYIHFMHIYKHLSVMLFWHKKCVYSIPPWVLFGDILNYFKFVDFKKNLKIGLSSIVKMYVVSVLLCAMQWHVFIIIRHPVIFNLEPPTLQEYFR